MQSNTPKKDSIIDVEPLIDDLDNMDSFQGYKLENNRLNPDEFDELICLHAEMPDALTMAEVRRLRELSQKNLPDYGEI